MIEIKSPTIGDRQFRYVYFGAILINLLCLLIPSKAIANPFLQRKDSGQKGLTRERIKAEDKNHAKKPATKTRREKPNPVDAKAAGKDSYRAGKNPRRIQ